MERRNPVWLKKNEPNITYINKNIGARVTQNTVNFDFGFKKHNNIFMKLDIG